MAKLITVTIDDNGNFAVDLTGFEGKGCSETADMFATLGTRTKDIKKPEYHAKQKQTVCK